MLYFHESEPMIIYTCNTDRVVVKELWLHIQTSPSGDNYYIIIIMITSVSSVLLYSKYMTNGFTSKGVQPLPPPNVLFK